MSDDIQTDSVSFGLIVINLTVWVLGILQSKIPILSIFPVSVESGGIYVPAIEAGQWFRIVTAMFIHDGPVHLMSNMLGVFALGTMLEKGFGKKRFLTVYLSGGIGGNLTVILKDILSSSFHYTIGASGAVMGLLGAVLVITLANRDRIGKVYLRRVLFDCLLMLVPASQNVSLSAHLGGFLFGGLSTLLMMVFMRRSQ